MFFRNARFLLNGEKQEVAVETTICRGEERAQSKRTAFFFSVSKEAA